MSKSTVSRNTNANKKAHCNVCKNAGKPTSEYTNHFTKTQIGNKLIVVCPTILNTICTYCKEKGHFKAECEVLKQKNNNKTQTITITATLASKPNPKPKTAPAKKPTTKTKTVYAEAFESDSDNEDEREDNTKTIRLTIRNPRNMVIRDIKHSWADDAYWNDSDEDM
jgi:hypothetical protein